MAAQFPDPKDKPRNLGKFIPLGEDIVLVCKNAKYFYMHRRKNPREYYGKNPAEKIFSSGKWTEKKNENGGKAFQLDEEMAARAERIIREIIDPVTRFQKNKTRKAGAKSRHDARIIHQGRRRTA